MPKEIEPKLKLISIYLSSQELFVIPEYQRSYSWTVMECDKLWQDVETFMDELKNVLRTENHKKAAPRRKK